MKCTTTNTKEQHNLLFGAFKTRKGANAFADRHSSGDWAMVVVRHIGWWDRWDNPSGISKIAALQQPLPNI